MARKKDILASSRKLKRRRVLLKAALGAGGFLVLSAAVSALFYIPAFRIKNIAVQGNSTLESGEIISAASRFLQGKYFGIFPKDNILIFPKEEISAGVAGDFGRIKEIAVDGDFPDSLLINITERKPTALFCGQLPTPSSETPNYNTLSNPPKSDLPAGRQASDGSGGGDCFFVDGDGVVFEKAPVFSDNVYVKFYGEKTGEREISGFGKMMDFVKTAQNGGVDIIKIVMEKDGLRKFYTSEGWHIMLNENDDFQIAFENLKLALEEKIKENRKYLDYIDLRFGNKLFYKYK
ncbi:MAG: FtsQ-type POTRA domain-containing protein [bacterium]|nr:FtsQ-type POTRA domain-containing protein [bacterium]